MEHVLSLSYGKDSLACLGAIEELGWPLTRIVHAEVWATDTIPADLPPMVEFKAKADTIIKARWGIQVEHIRSQWTYERHFYNRHFYINGKQQLDFPQNNGIYGFPVRMGPWCNSRLKVSALMKAQRNASCVYIGIAADEPSRFHNIVGKKKSPLVDAGWTEDICRKWCKDNNLLSPIYTDSLRGGCWFCHNQTVHQLRLLRKKYPEYWALMLKWDSASPVAFHADGHSVRDFERRFQLEDQGLISPEDKVFRWKMLDEELNYRIRGV